MRHLQLFNELRCTQFFSPHAERNSIIDKLIMSLEQIQSIAKNFISDTHNELLVIKGKWGVGKTFFWHKLIEECRGERLVGTTYYSYVSLFGVNSLEELKNAILVSRVESNADKAEE